MQDTVGEIAGYIWNYLEEEGEVSLTQVNEAVDEPRSRVNMAIGWLAREDKIAFNDEGRGVSVRLK